MARLGRSAGAGAAPTDKGTAASVAFKNVRRFISRMMLDCAESVEQRNDSRSLAPDKRQPKYKELIPGVECSAVDTPTKALCFF